MFFSFWSSLFSQKKDHGFSKNDTFRKQFRPTSETIPQAQNLALRLPDLLLSAERIANTIIAGEHSRKRAGRGSKFWQYRLAVSGESIQSIDWRQSAKSDRAYVRETEDETVQTLCLWCDHSRSMQWKSNPNFMSKQEQAFLISLTISHLLLGSGERLRLLCNHQEVENFSGIYKFPSLAFALTRPRKENDEDLPELNLFLPNAWNILVSDFLYPIEQLEKFLKGLSQRPNRSLLIQIYDPAEQMLPFQGRTRFSGLEDEEPIIFSNVGSLSKTYEKLWIDHQQQLKDICAKTGYHLLSHRLDYSPIQTLLQAWNILSVRRKRVV